MKRFARAGEFLSYLTDAIEVGEVSESYRPRQLFAALLAAWMDLHHDDLRYGIGLDVLQHVFPTPE